MKTTLLWSIIYLCWPCVLRVLEWMRVHNYRQDFLIGAIPIDRRSELQTFLTDQGFEQVALAWRDPGQVMSLRKIVDGGMWQYHLRLFNDGELRGHLEYAPEAKPFEHIIEKGLRRDEKFEQLLEPFFLDEKKTW